MTDKELIKQEIERRINISLAQGYTYSAAQLKRIFDFIGSLPEEHNEDLEEEISNYIKDNFFGSKSIGFLSNRTKGELDSVDVVNIARHFAEWQKQLDEKLFKDDSWNYIEENYPDISQEEKLRLYDISIKSRLAGANAIKQQMKEALQTEYEKGRYDMREEIMKTLIGGEIVKDVHNQLCVKSKPLNDTFRDVKFGDKVKIVIIQED